MIKTTMDTPRAEFNDTTVDSGHYDPYSGMQATYSPQDNKLRLYSESRLDPDTYRRVKDAGFAWAPKQRVFVAPMWTPCREDLLIELCGDIEDEDITMEERAADRAERFQEYSGNAGQRAKQAQDYVASIADGIPLGQPILVGHHSERRARKDAERIKAGMRRVVDNMKSADYWKRRARASIEHAQWKESREVRARRIKSIEADRRKKERKKEEAEKFLAAWTRTDVELTRQRALSIANYPGGGGEVTLGDGSKCWSAWSAMEDNRLSPEEVRDQLIPAYRHQIARCLRWIQHYDNRLEYERAFLEDQGGLISDRFDVKPGGSVLVGGEWLAVVRVNKSGGSINSVTTKAPLHIRWRETWKYGIEEVKDYRPPDATTAKAVKAATKLPPLCNYPGEGFQHITQADWDQRHKEMKGTKVIEATESAERHRVREWVAPHRSLTMGGLVKVFITDAKVKRPGTPNTQDEPAPALADIPREIDPAELARPAYKYEEPEWKKYEEAAKSIEPVSAPELFPTPPPVVERMFEAAGSLLAEASLHGMPLSALEPSAGSGAILSAMCKHLAIGRVDWCEINPGLRRRLETQGISSTQGYSPARAADFLEFNPGPLYDLIMMNPPFSADVAHVRHAFGMLRAGGRLVAIMSEGPFFRQFKADQDFRKWLDGVGGVSEQLPPDSFKQSGTGVNARLVIIDK